MKEGELPKLQDYTRVLFDAMEIPTWPVKYTALNGTSQQTLGNQCYNLITKSLTISQLLLINSNINFIKSHENQQSKQKMKNCAMKIINLKSFCLNASL